MTTVRIVRDGTEIRQVSVCGHAGFAPSGEDIVCAGISVLMTTGVNALEAVAGLMPNVVQDEKRALISLSLPDGGNADARHDAQVILRTVLQGLSDLSLAYPKYLTIVDGRQSP